VTLPPFQALIDEYGSEVHRFLVAAVGPIDGADCFQETFISALRAYPSLRDDSNLRGWLFTIAHRKTIDVHRARAKAPVPVGAVPERSSSVAGGGEVADEGLWGQVRELPAKQRTAVVHRFLGDLPYSEIAGILECTEAAARQNVQHALKTLRKEMVR
jgi:DNA-directed RNA polymerase specialized sigma24 family protein